MATYTRTVSGTVVERETRVQLPEGSDFAPAGALVIDRADGFQEVVQPDVLAADWAEVPEKRGKKDADLPAAPTVA